MYFFIESFDPESSGSWPGKILSILLTMSKSTTSGIRTAANGQSFIPASKRADGTTRKEIKVRPGYKPPEDVQRYRSKPAEALRQNGSPGVPGADSTDDVEAKNKNARRREAARKRKGQEDNVDQGSTEIDQGLATLQVDDIQQSSEMPQVTEDDNAEIDRQKKIRNGLKKLRAIHELKAKKRAGEKLSADQVIKIGKESEIIRDLAKLDYDGPEMGDQQQAE